MFSDFKPDVGDYVPPMLTVIKLATWLGACAPVGFIAGGL